MLRQRLVHFPHLSVYKHAHSAAAIEMYIQLTFFKLFYQPAGVPTPKQPAGPLTPKQPALTFEAWQNEALSRILLVSLVQYHVNVQMYNTKQLKGL